MICFVFFGLALLFSGGGVELLKFSSAHAPDAILWLGSAAGIVLGAFAGLLLSLLLQGQRGKSPNHSTEPTPGAVH